MTGGLFLPLHSSSELDELVSLWYAEHSDDSALGAGEKQRPVILMICLIWFNGQGFWTCVVACSSSLLTVTDAVASLEPDGLKASATS